MILRVWMRMSLKMFEVQFEACFWLKKMYDVTKPVVEKTLID